ncbi:hypothetical protein J6590_023939 [Homalodisca vitripennis]|nr:hypothetical protein J6590_023939 [Homalodisca vitripennis]
MIQPLSNHRLDYRGCVAVTEDVTTGLHWISSWYPTLSHSTSEDVVVAVTEDVAMDYTGSVAGIYLYHVERFQYSWAFGLKWQDREVTITQSLSNHRLDSRGWCGGCNRGCGKELHWISGWYISLSCGQISIEFGLLD